MDRPRKWPIRTAKRGHGWFRVGLRSLLLSVTIFGIWLAVICKRASRQRAAMEVITKAGIGVFYDYQPHNKGGPVQRDTPPPGPAWLRKMIGIDYFATVIGIVIDGGRQYSDSDFMAIQELPQLQNVSLFQLRVGDSALPHLQGLSSIRHLVVLEGSMNETDWEPLGEFPGLESLELFGSNVDDVILSRVTHVTSLRDLNIGNTCITDAGLQHLDRLSQLRTLDLGPNEMLTDAALRPLKAIPELETLDISWTRITDAGLHDLESLSQLTSLSIRGEEHITDAGLGSLTALLRLKNLDISWTGVTDAGLVHLDRLDQLETLDLAGNSRAIASRFAA